MGSIFISYRRADSIDVVGRIYDYLASEFGPESLFKDVYSIPAGADYREVLNDSVQSCDVLVVVIGADWLNAADKSGRRRLQNREDSVRIEIECALAAETIVVPVLVNGATMPTGDELPDSMRDLTFRNAVPLRPDPDFKGDMLRLVQVLNGYLGREPTDYSAVDGPGFAGLQGNECRRHPWSDITLSGNAFAALLVCGRDNQGKLAQIVVFPCGVTRTSTCLARPRQVAHQHPVSRWTRVSGSL